MNKGPALSGGVIAVVLVLAVVVVAAIGYNRLSGRHGTPPVLSDSRMQRMYGMPAQGGAQTPGTNPGVPGK